MSRTYQLYLVLKRMRKSLKGIPLQEFNHLYTFM